MKRHINRLFCLLITISLILPFSGASFAEAAEDCRIQRASDLEEYIDATAPADDPDPVFGAKRIKVKAVLDSFEGAACGVSYDGNTLLSFDTVEETEAAYDVLCEKYGEENVIIDIPLMRADSASGPWGWGTEYMNFDDEMKRRSRRSGQSTGKVTVAVIDSGINLSHDIFSGTQISPASKDLLNSSSGLADEEGHGTSVAGIVAESTPSDVELMILKTYTDGSSISMETVSQAIRYSADEGADVINLSMTVSLKNAKESSPALAAEMEKSVDDMEEQLKYAREKGAIIVASAGNDGRNMDELISFPAVSDNTIAVGSINRKGEWSFFSNYGSKVDFCAPGEELYVAANTGQQIYTPTLQPNKCSGTSFSAPYIAACCAMVKLDDADSGNQEAIELLKNKCIDYGDPGRDDKYGWGMPKYEDYTEPAADTDDAAAREARERSAAEARAKSTRSVTVNTGTVSAKAVKAAVAAAGGRTEYVTEIVLGRNVKKISRSAFKGTEVNTLIVKSKKLTKKSVKGSLKGSKIRAVKVKIGKKKTNKRYVKKYKTFFTKKNAGRKVSVKK